MRYLYLLLVFSAGFWACQPEEACISSATSRVVLDFYARTPVPGFPDSIRRDSILLTSVVGVGAAEAFLENDAADSTARVILRLNPGSDTSTFYFKGDYYVRATNGRVPIEETLVFQYKRRYRLISPDCPLEVTYESLQVLRNTQATAFDSVRVINTELVEPSTDMDVQIILGVPQE